jgi:DMSO/TMAO reductase YedYZ molybdopterin-dependent catalytic subunit
MTRRPDLAPALQAFDRRRLLRGGLSLGALTLLTGCNLADGDAADRVLWAMLRFNDRVQALLFSPTRLARTFPESAVTHPIRFNAFYPVSRVPAIDPATWRLELAGRIGERRAWSLADLRALPQSRQITRHVCVEGWSQIGDWSGVPLGLFLRRIGADLRAPYVGFRCADGYWSSIDMASALHPQTILALDFLQRPLAPEWGAPLRLRTPVKLGFKNPKHLTALMVTDTNPGGYWENQGYNWFSGS